MATTKNDKPGFKVGSQVKIKMLSSAGDGTYKRYKGTVTRGVPKGATRGEARLTVKTAEGYTIRPYPSQCEAA